MSRDWFDPLGLRGSRLDPFTHLKNAMLGRGIAADSAARMSTALARQLEGRRLDIGSDPPVTVTVDRLDEVRPVAGVDAVPTAVGDVPMFTTVSGDVRDVRIGDMRLDRIHIAANDIRFGSTGSGLRLGGASYEARVGATALLDQIASKSRDRPVLRFADGRIEGSDGIFARWFWMEFGVHAADKRVTFMPLAVRFRGRVIPVPRRVLRRIVEEEPRLPRPLTVDSVVVEGDEVVVRGTVREVVIPVDVTRVVTDLGTQTGRSALRVMIGDW